MLHVKFEFHSNRDTLTYFTAKNRSKSFICIHGLKNHIGASDLVHTLILWVSWSLLIFVMVGQFLALWQTKNTWKGVFLELPASEKFSSLFCPASRTTLVATRFRVAVICPIIQVPHCIRVFFYFVWFVFINHIFQFYYELCTYCNIFGYLPIIKFEFCQLCSVLYVVIELFIF